MNTSNEKTIKVAPETKDILDKLVRGENATVEAYDKLLEKFQNNDKAFKLKTIRTQHKENAKYWRNQLSKDNSKLTDNISIQKMLTNLFIEAGKIVGSNSALEFIKKVEMMRLNNYKDMLDNPLLPIRHKKVILNEFVPSQKKNIETLKAMVTK